MGARGPAPKPTALRVLHGDREDRINRNEPTPTGEIDVPGWLPSGAREVWDRLAPDLTRKGVLTAWDVDAFADLCAMVVVNRDALLDLDRNGASCSTVDRELSDGTLIYRLVKNPAWQVARESTAAIVSLGSRFGLTPADRTRLTVGEASRGSSEDLLSG